MPKTLKLFNGRGDCHDLRGHLFVAAYSQKHVVELLQKAGHVRMSLSELRVYWHTGTWGNPMAGITPEVGVWITREGEFGHLSKAPERVL